MTHDQFLIHLDELKLSLLQLLIALLHQIIALLVRIVCKLRLGHFLLNFLFLTLQLLVLPEELLVAHRLHLCLQMCNFLLELIDGPLLFAILVPERAQRQIFLLDRLPQVVILALERQKLILVILDLLSVAPRLGQLLAQLFALGLDLLDGGGEHYGRMATPTLGSFSSPLQFLGLGRSLLLLMLMLLMMLLLQLLLFLLAVGLDAHAPMRAMQRPSLIVVWLVVVVQGGGSAANSTTVPVGGEERSRT